MSRHISSGLVSLHALGKKKDFSGAGSVLRLGFCHNIWSMLLVSSFYARTVQLSNCAMRHEQPYSLSKITTQRSLQSALSGKFADWVQNSFQFGRTQSCEDEEMTTLWRETAVSPLLQRWTCSASPGFIKSKSIFTVVAWCR